MLCLLQRIQREIQVEHVDEWLAEDAQEALCRYSRHLVERASNRNIRVEPRTRGRDEINRHRAGRRVWVLLLQSCDTLLYVLDQDAVRWPQVRGGRVIGGVWFGCSSIRID